VSNGFIDLTLPFVPGTVDGMIRSVVRAPAVLAPGEHQRLSVSRQPDARFGELSCLSFTTWSQSERPGSARTGVFEVTWCLDSRGLPVSEHQHGAPTLSLPWADLMLVSERPVAPASDFSPLSRPAGKGTLPPV
jgi:hypothetical protein